jgi:hypothetical protein
MNQPAGINICNVLIISGPATPRFGGGKYLLACMHPAQEPGSHVITIFTLLFRMKMDKNIILHV